MRFTGMDQDRVELNTCRDFFMTPEKVGKRGGRGAGRTGVAEAEAQGADRASLALHLAVGEVGAVVPGVAAGGRA